MNKIYPCCSAFTNQGHFTSTCFKAAGNITCSDKKTASHDYERKIYNGSKKLTDSIRSKFPTPADSESLAKLFKDKIDKGKINDIFSSFGIPQSSPQKIELFAMALALQFQLFISSSEIDVDDIVAIEYQKLLLNAVSDTTAITTPLYLGDSAWVTNNLSNLTIKVKRYEKFQYTWSILNNGNQTWRNRSLFFKNHSDVRPRADSNYLEVPTTPPKEEIKITASFDARGFEGEFNCAWEMVDIDKKDCFPNSKSLFTIKIIVER